MWHWLWGWWCLSSGQATLISQAIQCFINHSTNIPPTQLIAVRLLTVFQTLFILEKKHNVDWVLLYVHMIWKCFQWHMSVVSLPSTCLIIAIVTYAKKCLISDVPLALNSRGTAVQYSLLHIQLRSWWRLLVLLWLFWRMWCQRWLN